MTPLNLKELDDISIEHFQLLRKQDSNFTNMQDLEDEDVFIKREV